MVTDRVLLTSVTSADQNPGRGVRLDVITPRHRKVNILCKVDKIVDGLLDCQHLKTLRRKVVIRIGIPEETVLEEDGGPLFLLSDHAIDGFVSEVTFIACKGVRRQGKACNSNQVPSASVSPGVISTIGPPRLIWIQNFDTKQARWGHTSVVKFTIHPVSLLEGAKAGIVVVDQLIEVVHGRERR